MSVVRGSHRTHEGKVLSVYRKKFVVHLERLTRDKATGAQRAPSSLAAPPQPAHAPRRPAPWTLQARACPSASTPARWSSPS